MTNPMMTRPPVIALSALLFSGAVLMLGYLAFGFWTMLVFTSGFLGGFLLWLSTTARPSYEAIRLPFLLTFGLFIAHRVEENRTGFFNVLADITGATKPDILSWPVLLLVLLSVGAWLLIPTLVKRGHEFGYYLAWTFFAAMGITELAHFVVFPFVIDAPFGYFPGMASVVVLAPVAWWGMWRLARNNVEPA